MATCKDCGKTIVFAKTPEGKIIPLDPTAPVYWVFTINEKDMAKRIEPQPVSVFPAVMPEARPMVSHFSTCPKAGDFSRRKTG